MCGLLDVSAEELVAGDEWEFLFVNSPVPSMIQDWRPIYDWFAELRAQGVADLASYLDADPEAAIGRLAQVRIIAVNKAMVGTDDVDSPEGILGPFRRAAVRDAWHSYRDQLLMTWQGDVSDVEYETTTRAGRPIIVAVSVAEHPRRRGLRFVTIRDLTEVRRVQAALEESHASKDQFVASVAHELRTPMTAVVGFASELASRFDDLDEVEREEMLRILARESREVAAIVDDLLVAARAEIGGVTVTHDRLDLSAIARDVIDGLETTVVMGSTATVDVCGDPVRVRQIVRNLVTNADRHGGPNGRVLVGLADGSGFLEVRDDGSPLAPELVERMFDPYERGGGRIGVSESVGLGLSVAHQLAEAMNGELLVARDGRETVFRLVLPVSTCPTAEPLQEPAN